MLKALLKSAARKAVCAPWRLLAGVGIDGVAPVPVQFVVEKANWSIRWDGIYITDGVNALRPNTAVVTDRPERAVRRIVHFGSQFMWSEWRRHLAPSNRYLVTYFHGKPEDGPVVARNLEDVLESLPQLEKVITAASITEQRLLGWGVPREKLIRIPIGVDTAHFRPPQPDERLELRRKFGIAKDQICIGSFQKDGVGWGDGLEPKLIKGPDLFLGVVGRLSRDFPIFVLLTGPARGYVKRGLERLGIPYLHRFLENYRELADYYRALDLYLVTSREEGGPKAIMESMASGVPILSTRVGMAPDIIENGINGWMAEMEDVDTLAEQAARVIVGPDYAENLVARARDDVAAYDWENIAAQHLNEAYASLLDERGKGP